MARAVKFADLPSSICDDDRTHNMPAATLPSIAPNASPFLLQVTDIDLLDQSEGFTILRQHLAEHYTCYGLCDAHSTAHPENLDKWLLVRDVLHALLVPVVELFDKACGVAATITQATKLEDLEYAFTGQSRSAFVWLHCFLASDKERDWCYTRGCPACIVDHSMDSEFTIRLLYAACLLSDVHYPFTIDGPTLPSFMFFLETLERATEADPLYGEDFFELMQPKAIATRDGIEELIHQCLELDMSTSQPISPDTSDPETSPVVGPLGGQPGMKIKRSKMAKRQLKLQREEEQWMQQMLQHCWQQIQHQEQLLPLTATQNLDAVLKSTSRVSVNELVPE